MSSVTVYESIELCINDSVFSDNLTTAKQIAEGYCSVVNTGFGFLKKGRVQSVSKNH